MGVVCLFGEGDLGFVCLFVLVRLDPLKRCSNLL